MTTTIPSVERDHVRRHTCSRTLQRIEDNIEESIRFYANQPTVVISRRIEELDKEWSIERWLETHASTVAFTGAVMGLAGNRKWFALPLLATGFLFLHAVRGWCPPLPVLRRLGVRTRSEIDREKFALKLLRGDFKNLETAGDEEPPQVRRILDAINA